MTVYPTRSLLSALGVLVLVPLTACATAGSAPPENAFQQDSVVGDYLKGRFAAGQQQLDEAAQAYASALDAEPQDTVLLRQAFFYELAAGNVPAARGYAEQLMQPEFREAGPGEAENAADLARAVIAARAQQGSSLPVLTVAADQMRQGRYAAALDTLDRDQNTTYSRSISYLMKVWATYETQGVDAAIAMLDAPGEGTFSGFSNFHRALMLEASGRDDAALEAFQRALADYPDEQTQLAFAGFLERQRDREGAREAYRRMVESDGPLSRTGRLGLIRLGEPLDGETREMRRAARRQDPPRPVESGAEGAAMALYQFAWASYRQAMSEQIAAQRAGFSQMQLLLNTPLAHAQLADHLDPDFEPVHYLIGAVYNTYEMRDDAARMLEQISYTDAFYEFAVTDLADIYEARDEPERAAEILRDYIDGDVFAVGASLRLSNLQADAGDMDAAEETLTEAIARIEARPAEAQGNDLWRYYFSRGVLKHDADNWPGAEADLQRALELSDENAFVLNYLGYSWVERGENLTEAFAMIEQALDDEPNSGAITDSLGWAYYQLDEYEQALTYLERAVELEPADAVITDHLGDVYWELGRYNEARYEWRRALTYEPEDDLRTAIEDKLESRRRPGATAQEATASDETAGYGEGSDAAKASAEEPDDAGEPMPADGRD